MKIVFREFGGAFLAAASFMIILSLFLSGLPVIKSFVAFWIKYIMG